MPPEFSFHVDPSIDLVSVTMAGFFKPEDVVRFSIARDAAHRRLTCEPNQHLTLIDIRDMQIQSQEAVAAFSTVLHCPAYYSRRIAFVVTKSLAKMQVQRAARDRPVRYVLDDVALARKWLLSNEAIAA